MSLTPQQSQLVQDRFKGIFENSLLDEISLSTSLVTISEDHLLIDIDDPIEFLPLVLSGSLKIMTEDNEGRELLLYYLENGDTCAVTINCCTSETKSKVRAIVEQDATVILVPIKMVESWMAQYASWRNFILETYNYRMNELLIAIDSLAFNNMESRVLKYLRDRVMVVGNTQIQCTHLEIANDLHSSRVVISRVLKKLEIENKINQKRNTITLNHL